MATANERYGSDLMVDLMQNLGYRYVSLNPGSSFRGLHDSIVNYGGNSPEIIECPHEKVAVGLAHGYAKASGEPMAVILHNVVGLLQGTMGIYYAYIDRAPVMVYGGAGPMETTRRRPNIDWIHTANTQGNVVRDFTKWDDQPTTLSSMPNSLVRGHRVATSQPQGPVYIGLDAGLQEDVMHEDVPLPNMDRLKTPVPPGADSESLDELARILVDAQRPVVIPGYLGRDNATWEPLVEFAELLGVGVIDTNIRLNFPNRHPHNVTGSRALEDADVVFFLDVNDMGKPTQSLDKINRVITSQIPDSATIVDLGFNDVELSAWSHDFAALAETDLQITADAVRVLPELLERCRTLLDQEQGDHRAQQRQQRREELGRIHQETWDNWARIRSEAWDNQPVSLPRLTADVWEAIKDHDWVLTAGTAHDWALRTWDFDQPYRHAGAGLGTATQISISLGVALHHRDHGRLVVDLQPDGDLMFDPGALWVASYHKIPMLAVMFNNRAYYNDWEHQERMAHQRGTAMENAYLGMEIDNPAPDFANIARSFGWYGEGPITDPGDTVEAVTRAAKVVTETGQPALVDVVCEYK